MRPFAARDGGGAPHHRSRCVEWAPGGDEDAGTTPPGTCAGPLPADSCCGEHT
ncbi:MAG: hypothetical protein ACLVGA_11640 [Dysosmobacter sp.]